MADGLSTSISPVAPASSTAPVSGSAMRTRRRARQARAVEPPPVGVLHRVGRDHRDLAGAVRGEPAHAGAAGDGAGDLFGHRGRAPHDVAQRAQVEVLEPRVVGHAERDRRDRHLERHAFLLDGAQRRVEVEARVQADPRARGHRGHDVEQPEDVHRWRRDLEAVAVGEAERGDPVLDRVAQRAVGVAHRLREPGRPRAEDEHRVGVGIVVDGGDRGSADGGQRRRTRAPGPTERVGERRHPAASPSRAAGRRSRTACSTSVGLPRRAEHHDRRAELQRAVDREHELRPVGRHQRDAGATARAGGGQRRGPLVGAGLQVAEREGAVLEVERHPFVIARRPAPQHLGQRAPVRPVAHR